MPSAIVDPPEQGQLVQIRSRQWVVNDVKPSTLPPPALRPEFHRPQSLLTLSSVEDDGLGEELQVVWEIEPGARVIEKVALPTPTDFDSPDKLDAFLDAVRWGAASTADLKNIQSPFRSGIEIEDYQLDPVVRAIQMPRVNLLIADDVGLGKTIEAGMVGLELIIRHRARKILVVCPSALQIQWRDQMRDKFGLDFRIVDSSLMRGYDALVRAFLTHSVLEQYLQVTGQKMAQIEAAHVLRQSDRVMARVFNDDEDGKLFAFLHARVNSQLQHQLTRCRDQECLNMGIVSSAIRHIFVHGFLTANTNEVKPQRVIRTCNEVSTFLVEYMDDDFLDRMRQFARGKNV
jgi:hypothetical protein